MATEILRPNAAGDEESIASATSGSGNHWQDVDEATPDEDTSRVYTNAMTLQRDLYNLPAHSGSGTINFIKIYVRCKRDSVGGFYGYTKPSLKSNSTVTDGTEVEVTSAYVTYSQQWSTNPADGEAWEWSDIDALQIGVLLKTNSTKYSAHCTQVYVEVDYTPGVTEKTSSDTGSGADGYVSLETGEVKTSSDAGSGIDGTPLPGASLAGNETGSGIEALAFRLLAAFDAGTGIDIGNVEIEGTLKNLFAGELGEGSDCLIAKIEMPTKGGGMKLWT